MSRSGERPSMQQNQKTPREILAIPDPRIGLTNQENREQKVPTVEAFAEDKRRKASCRFFSILGCNGCSSLRSERNSRISILWAGNWTRELIFSPFE